MRNVLITGALGYLGKNLFFELAKDNINILATDYRSRTAHDPQYSTFRMLNDELINNELKIFNLDAVVHLAVASRKDSNVETISKNIKLGLNLLDHCVQNNLVFIYARSYWEDLVNIEEALTPYSQSKRIFHEIITEFYSQHSGYIASLALGDVYGPQDKRNKLVPYILESIKESKIIHLDSPSNKYFPTHVADVTNVIKGLIHKTIPTNHYNLYPKNPSTVSEVVTHFETILERKLNLCYTNKRKFNFDYTNLQKNWPLRYDPITFEYGLKNLIKSELQIA